MAMAMASLPAFTCLWVAYLIYETREFVALCGRGKALAPALALPVAGGYMLQFVISAGCRA